MDPDWTHPRRLDTSEHASTAGRTAPRAVKGYGKTGTRTGDITLFNGPSPRSALDHPRGKGPEKDVAQKTARFAAALSLARAF